MQKDQHPGFDKEDKKALIRTVSIASIVLGLILTLVYLFTPKLFPNNPSLVNSLRTAFSLLAFWIVITSTVRTYDRVRKDISFLWLILTGVATAFVGILLFLLALRVWNLIGGHGASLPKYSILGFYTLGGLIASLISMINVRVKGKHNGNLLELLVIALAVALFYWIG